MGKCGTEVAKDASEMVIKDDNFATIVYAVQEGRTIYGNIQKFIYYLLPGNFSGVMLILIATLAGFFPPLTPLMILFINLVTSDIPALGLAFEKPDKHIMLQKPRHPKEPILSPYILLKISQVVPIMFLGTLLLYMWEFNYAHADLETARTVAFVSVILFTLFHTLNAKNFSKTLFRRETLTNPLMYMGLGISLTVMFLVVYAPPLQPIFSTVSLSLRQWIPILITTGSVIAFVEVQKTIIESEIREREQSNVHPTRG